MLTYFLTTHALPAKYKVTCYLHIYFSSHQPCKLGVYSHVTNEKTRAQRRQQVRPHTAIEKPRFFGPCSCSLKAITVPTVTLSSGRHRHRNGGSLVQPPASCSVCAPREPLGFRKKAEIPKGYVCQQHSEIFFVIGMATNLQFSHF